MVFRVTEEGRQSTKTTFRLAGRLAEDAAAVLVSACEGVMLGVTIDLSEVDFADAGGVSALGDLRARGAVLRGARPYLTLLLAHDALLRRGD